MRTHYRSTDALLDPDFYRLIGEYVTVCALIEGEIFWIHYMHEAPAPSEQDAVNQILKDQKSLQKLLEKFSVLSERQSASLRDKLLEVHRLIHDGLIDRHMAVHGRWWKDGDTYRVEYFKQMIAGDPDSWKIYDDAISLERIQQSIHGAQAILSDLRRLAPLVEPKHDI